MEYSNYDNQAHNEKGEEICSNFEPTFNSDGNGYTYITVNDIVEYTKKSEELVSSIKPFNIENKIKFKYFGPEIIDKNGDKKRISFIADEWYNFRPIMYLLMN